MAQSRTPHAGDSPARCLLVLLPGAGDGMATFADEGFTAAIHASGLSIDLVTADATLGYYYRGTVDDRLGHDVLTPARPGHAHVWLLGVSMGGFGALHYTQQHADEIDGVIAFAPYLGAHKLTAEIQRAGGLARWTPDPPAPLTRHNYQRQLWSWLQRTTTPGAHGPTLLIGRGDDDRRAASADALAAVLPADQVFHAPGGHDWPVWRTLLAAALKHPRFIERCGSVDDTARGE